MTNPITVHPRQNTVEAMQFDGSHDSATDLANWLYASTKDTPTGRRLAMNYACGLGEVTEFNVFINEDTYELAPGDWIIKDGGLFSMVRRQDFPFRYVDGIEKIKIEAGMS